MAAFGSIIYVVILIFIVSSVIKRAKKAGGTLNNPVNPARSVAGKTARRTGFTNYRPHKDIISVSRDMGDAKGSSTLRDDRNNDWLARQLREEHRAFKMTSEMFDLKIEHASQKVLFFHDDGSPCLTGARSLPKAKAIYTCPECHSTLRYLRVRNGRNAGKTIFLCPNAQGHQSGKALFFEDQEGEPLL